MSWREYIDSQLLAKNLKDGAIFGVKTGKEIVREGSPFTGKDIQAAKSDSVKEAGKSREQSGTLSNVGDKMNGQSHDKGTAVEGVIFSTLLKYFTLVPKLIKCVVFVVTCQMCYVDQGSTDYGIHPSQCLASCVHKPIHSCMSGLGESVRFFLLQLYDYE